MGTPRVRARYGQGSQPGADRDPSRLVRLMEAHRAPGRRAGGTNARYIPVVQRTFER